MHCPENGIYIIIGEMNMVLTAMRRSNRWSSHIHQEDEQDNIFKSFISLKDSVNHLSNLSDLDPIHYLTPFLDVIRSENTTGVVTCHGLSAVHKFLSYGLIDAKSPCASVAAENIADAVTHARFMGTDASCDEVVLVKIIQVLRLLLLSPLGTLLTNESVCELIQSFFRICFEIRFSEILRRIGESALTDAVQLLFSCLPQFTEDLRFTSGKRLKMRSGNLSKGSFYRKKQLIDSGNVLPQPSKADVPCNGFLMSSESDKSAQIQSKQDINVLSSNLEVYGKDSLRLKNQAIPTSITPSDENVVSLDSRSSFTNGASDTENLTLFCESNADFTNLTNVSTMQSEKVIQNRSLDLNSIWKDCEFAEPSALQMVNSEKCEEAETADVINENMHPVDVSEDISSLCTLSDADYVNPRGVRFTLHPAPKDGSGPLIPYGLPCVRELFKLLISLINPQDRHNTELTIQIGLNLITIALESGADNLGKFGSLLAYIKDDMCKNLFTLLATDRLAIFSTCLRIFFLLFEALRTHLKFQLEMFLMKLMEIIISESAKISYEQQQMSLDCITQLWRIPGLVTELFINYDCDLYCSNLFEDLTKLLSKNAFPLSGLYSVHLLSLDALIAVIDSIESNCHCRMLSERVSSYEKGSNSIESTTANELHSNKKSMSHGASGYLCGQQLLLSKEHKDKELCLTKDAKNHPYIKPNRMKVSSNIPNHEELMAIKHKKKILASGTEQFNSQPSKGISFLQDHELLKSPLDSQEVAAFLRDNPQLDKKMIGEYISNRKNLKVLESFVRSFAFENTRIDEALRQYLETFRLPGEAPLISLIMEHFAEHWHKSNKEPFANSDAAFTLAYAVIMLNVDQHNHNVKKQNIPMTLEDFKKNLKNVNGGEDFDDDMLEKIYSSIRCEEIVMPAEQTGLVRENYLWKVLLRRGNCKEGKFLHTPNGIFDHDLFSLAWGPTVAALSFIFDKSVDPNIIEKTIAGFHKCATIAAHYKMCEVFDNLIISVCKFTSLLNSSENPKSLPITFGSNKKAQLATKAAFRLANLHRDILREGWKNLLDCFLHLFNAKLLPPELVEAEDFLNPNGVISLIREDLSIPRTESGLFSSFYSYITSDSPSQRLLTQEDEMAKQAAVECIKDCHSEQLINESKFFEIDSLQELVKTLIFLCRCPEPNVSSCSVSFDEDLSVFVLEILVKIVLLNRDRILSIWTGIQDHLFRLVMNSAISENTYLLERSVVGILRIAVRLVRKEEMIPQVLQSLQVLLYLKSPSLILVSRQVAYALHELLKTNAANIHFQTHWSIIFSLLERVGAGAKLMQKANVISELPKEYHSLSEPSGAQSDSELSVGHHERESDFSTDRGYTSDSELYENQVTQHNSQHVHHSHEKTLHHSENAGSQTTWIMVNREGEVENSKIRSLPLNQYNIVLNQELLPHDSLAYLKCCESLAFLVRDAAHITTENFESCIHCIRTFVEASANGGFTVEKKTVRTKFNKEKKLSKSIPKRKEESKPKRQRSQPNKIGEGYDADDDEKHDDLSPAYQQVSMQLLDLMHTLHTRASSIFAPVDTQSKTNESLWNSCWCPLLQGIARLCCDTRRPIRTSALTLLPRALLVHDLQTLSPAEWEACFNKVLFPLLAKLLENITPDDPIGMEETRMRGATLLCKVFLQHLTPLLSLPTFMALWLTILDFMDKYMHADGSGLLAEAIPESLKNMLLVMDTAGVFKKPEDFPTSEDQMWHITWDRINTFLPALQKELFKSSEPPTVPVNPSNRTAGEVVINVSQDNEQSTKVLSANNEDSNIECQGEITTSIPSTDTDIQYDSSFQMTPPVSVILHPPVTPLIYSSRPNMTVSSCPQLLVTSTNMSSHVAVPLLLDPVVMSDASMPIFNTQSTSNP